MNRYHSLSFKHFLTIMLILLVSFVLLGTAFVGFSYRYAMTEKREAMRSAAGETCRIVRAYSADADFNEVDLRMPISSLSNTWSARRTERSLPAPTSSLSADIWESLCRSMC